MNTFLVNIEIMATLRATASAGMFRGFIVRPQDAPVYGG